MQTDDRRAFDSLSFSNSAGLGVSIQAGANETLTNCLFANNGGSGLQVISRG